MIIRGEIQEGEHLRQDVIAAYLQVSHVPVREALRQLEAEG
jgi:DNA-binding GntR family transcriptional regulator